MIHQYVNNGYHIVLDVNSGSVHVVDELCYDVIQALDTMGVYRGSEAEKDSGKGALYAHRT